MPLHFLLDQPTAAASGDEVTLAGDEAHHASSVRRLRVGESVTVGDGAGVWLDGVCEQVSAREVRIRVQQRREIPAPAQRFVMVQALAKTDRDERALQAAVELGVDQVIPWQAERSVSRWDAEKADKARRRWEAVAREATKQAHRAWLPGIEPVHSTAQLVRSIPQLRTMILDPTAPETLLKVLGENPDSAGDLMVIVGPEGGITDQEGAAFVAAGAHRARLGDTILRTSTAGPAAVAVASAFVGRW